MEPMDKIRVIVADATDIARIGVVTILNEYRSLEVVSTAITADEVCCKYEKLRPDVCLISSNINDLNLHQIMSRLRQVDKSPAVIVLTYSADLTHLNQALKAGVSGYLLKSIGKTELKNAVLSAAKGEKVFSNPVTKLMTNRYADLAQKREPIDIDLITKREREVLQLIVDGYTSQEIAKLLYISPRTVETHRSNLLHKLNIKNTAALVKYAMEEGSLED